MTEYRGTDFSKRNKDVLVITLGTEEESFDVKIKPPTVNINKGMIKIAGLIDQAAKGELDYSTFDMDECLEIVAETMSNNTDMRRITPEYLASVGFDISDVGDFLGGYLLFITRLVEGKN